MNLLRPQTSLRSSLRRCLGLPEDSSGTRCPGQSGYILALLLGMVTVMGLMLTKVVPSVVAEVQRDAEEELIFRGESIARGIRAYQARTGAYPSSLDDLMKLRPPVLRKIYKDPMSKSGEWELVTAVQPGPSGNTQGLPIVGVRSKAQINSFKIYKSKSMVSEWVFSAADDIMGVPGDPAGPKPSGPSGEPSDPIGEGTPPPIEDPE